MIACFVRPVLLEANWLDNFLMNTFPGLRDWARDQSDQFSRSMGKTPDGSTYVMSYTLDFVLGAFMLVIVMFMHAQAFEWGWFDVSRAFGLLKFIGFKENAALAYRFQGLYAILYGIPLIICGLYSSRPIRFGLAITAVLALNLGWYRSRGDDTTLYQGRTYFGILRVLQSDESLMHPNEQRNRMIPNDEAEFKDFTGIAQGKEAQTKYKYTYLMHGTTYHGRNYMYRPGDDNVDLSRLATTYYHRYGPVGFVMERDNWLPGPQNTFWGDARIPTGTVGNILATLGTTPVPYHTLLNAAVSERPYATIGLGTGTMASYCRPYQHLTFYEIDSRIRTFSLPPRGEPELLRNGQSFFTYLLGAVRRGANLEVVMGDARLTMEHQLELWERNNDMSLYPILPGDKRTGAEGEDSPFATLANSTMMQNRDNYYHAIEVDAFSSDAIPVHLITKEAIRMYLSKITFDGVVMVHTSNRHLDLVQPVAKIVEELDEEFQQKYKDEAAQIEKDYKAEKIDEATRDMRKERAKQLSRVRCLVAKDQDQREKYLGHFSSEYVMVYYDEKYLKPAKNYTPLTTGNIYDHSIVQWHAPEISPRATAWTDDYSNLWSIMR